MYVIAIGWLYVTLLMAATEANLTAGVLTFGLYGLAPLALFLWLFGTPQRRRNQRAADQRAADGVEPGLAREAIDDVVGKDDGADPRRDQ
jgi:heme A synthase